MQVHLFYTLFYNIAMKNFYKHTDNGILLNIKVIPNSSKTAVVGTEVSPLTNEMFLKVKISAPANENKANEELIKFLSKTWKIPKSALELVKGDKCKEKKVLIKNKDCIITKTFQKDNCPPV